MEEGEQPSLQLRDWRVKKDNENIVGLISYLCDPFGDLLSSLPDLLNISSGKAASE